MKQIAKAGQVAAMLAFVYSLLVALWLVVFPGSSPNGGRFWTSAIPLLAIPVVIAAVGAFVGLSRSVGARFWVRVGVAILMTLWGTIWITLLGLFFIPADIAAIVSAIQSKPKSQRLAPA